MATIELYWNPSDPMDPGPCIDVSVMNSADVIEAGQAIGLEYPKPVTMKALLDTGASVTVISKTYANHCKLFQTSQSLEISAIGATHTCGEHAGAISFPGKPLRPLNSIRIVSAVFAKERHYACLIGRDILRNWTITFNGPAKKVIITE